MTVAASLRALVVPNVRRLLASQAVSTLVARAFRGDIPSRGLRFSVNNAAVGTTTAAELLFRLYERHEIAFVRHQMLKGYDVLELGAGIGVTGSHVLQRLSDDRRLIAVEANPALHPTLRTNLRRHRKGHEIDVVHAAISYSGADRVTLSQGLDHTRSHVDSASRSEGIPALTLGALVARFELKSYILISDIEGAERDVILRDATSLASCQQLIIELHGGASEISDMFEALVHQGFRLSARRKTIYTFTRSPKQAG